jgi:hypothetical protein
MAQRHERGSGMHGRRWMAIVGALLLGTSLTQGARAASEAEIERLSSLALLLGRGIGCRLDTNRASAVIGSWFDKTFPPGTAAQERYLPVFAEEVEQHAREQRTGGSPDSCADVAHAFYTMRW